MTLSITRVALACACALLTGCASMSGIAPQAQSRNANELASQHALSATSTSSAAWPKADWWEAYGDAQLDALIDEALAHSPTLNVAAARTRKALAVADASQSALSPRIDASASSTRARCPISPKRSTAAASARSARGRPRACPAKVRGGPA